MSDTQYKPTTLGHRHTPANSLGLSHPSEFVRPPAALAARSQDTNLAGFRTLLCHHLGGSDEFQVFSGTPTLLLSPDFVTWRTLAEVMETTTAGTVLAARCISVPSGGQVFDDGGVTSISVGGEARLIFTWHNEAGATTTATAMLELAGPSADALGAEQPAQGAAWAQLHHSKALVIRPPGAANIPATAEAWSEDNTVKIELQVRGGARLVNVTVSEVPSDHVSEHDSDAVTTNGASQTLAWEGKIPQTSALDGATFEERRYGIERALVVAGRQTERVGPAVARWGSFTGDGTAPIVTDPDPKVITAAAGSLERVSGGTNTAWDDASPGFWIMSTGQEPDSRRQRGRGPVKFATMRVRVRLHCRFASAGSGVGLFRLASSARGWLDIKPDRAVIGTTWTWLTVTGWLEANIATDDSYCVLQDFGSRGSSAANLEIRYWDVLYGWQQSYLGQ